MAPVLSDTPSLSAACHNLCQQSTRSGRERFDHWVSVQRHPQYTYAPSTWTRSLLGRSISDHGSLSHSSSRLPVRPPAAARAGPTQTGRRACLPRVAWRRQGGRCSSCRLFGRWQMDSWKRLPVPFLSTMRSSYPSPCDTSASLKSSGPISKFAATWSRSISSQW